MKKIPSKADIRRDLEQEMALYQSGGGEVTEVPNGVSGRDVMDNSPPPTQRLFLEPTTPRTQVPEVIAAIEARRKEKTKHKPQSKTRRKPQPKKKTIYDDFGEPLRTVWVDE